MKEFKTINNNANAEIIEKRSKFIANIFYVQNEEEINNILKNIKKEYFDAKHNCYAYRIIENENIIQRSSDDGEPSRNSRKTYIEHFRKKSIC